DAGSCHGTPPLVGHDDVIGDYPEREVLTCRPPAGAPPGRRPPDVRPVELAAHEGEMRTATGRVPGAEHPAVDAAHVVSPGVAHEGDLGAHRAPQLADVVALEQRLDAVGRTH